MIKKKQISVDYIPAIIWGDKSNKIFIHVHGKLSNKESAEQFALIAEKKGYQTISFDLAEHGERRDLSNRCDIWNGMKDLTVIAEYVFANWDEVSLYACSLGAYFALNTYTERHFENILFQSPIVDMKWLVQQMMLWFNISEARLERENEIDTPVDALRWDYYNYIKEHPIDNWHKNTKILYGGLDNLQSRECIDFFAERFDGIITFSDKSEHAFMADDDYEIVRDWLNSSISK